MLLSCWETCMQQVHSVRQGLGEKGCLAVPEWN